MAEVRADFSEGSQDRVVVDGVKCIGNVAVNENIGGRARDQGARLPSTQVNTIRAEGGKLMRVGMFRQSFPPLLDGKFGQDLAEDSGDGQESHPPGLWTGGSAERH